MYKHQLKVRVRYSETDKMGIVYHGNFVPYFEIGRVELMREIGLVYKDLEDEGVLMPVVHLEIDFKHPVVYDEQITIETWVEKLPTTKMVFYHKVFSEAENLVCTGNVILVFINKHFKPIRASEKIREALRLKGIK
jgi:acyl-CoA thioester hydrolase